MQTRRVAIIEGFRTPFTRAFTDYAEMTAIDLAKVALAELVNRTEIDPNEIDEIAMGISIPKPSTTNVARIAALGIGLAETVPGRSALIDGFGLIAFASLFPIMTVIAYAQLAELRQRLVSRRRSSTPRGRMP